MITSRRSIRAVSLVVLVGIATGCGTRDTPTGVSADTVAPPRVSSATEPTVPTDAPTTTPVTTVGDVATTDVATSTTTTTDVATSTTTTTAPPMTTIPATVERSGAPAGPAVDVGDPLAIRIPSIGVDSALVPTGVLDDGTVAVPPDADIAGWFDRGPRPGERGPSLIMGHVDSARTGPGVFYELRNIEVGALVTVDNPGGSLDFVVNRIEQHAKLDFPTEEVYGPSPSSALRLVTCGGSFDRSVRSYYDNIIVYLDPVNP